jgi:hypothetical protein
LAEVTGNSLPTSHFRPLFLDEKVLLLCAKRVANTLNNITPMVIGKPHEIFARGSPP